MRIMIVNFEYPPLGGGGGVATRFIAEELAKRHEVHVVTSAVPKKLRRGRETDGNNRDDHGVMVHRVSVWPRKSLPTASLSSMITFVPSAWWVMRRLMKQNKFDVINAQFVVPSGIPAALIAQQAKCPLVLSFVGGDVFDPSKGISPHRHWWLRMVIRWVAKQADICTAISNDTKRRTVQWHKVRQKIVVTHLGIYPKHDGSKTRQELGLPDKGILFATVGRLIPRKGYEVLIKAWAKVPEAHLAVMGSGPLRDSLQLQVERLGMTERVHFLGYVDDKTKINILDRADGYVSASEHEGFGIVFLEAMESALPIVATWEGGQTDFLRMGHNAILVRPGDVKALSDGVNKLIADNDLRLSMGKANKQVVRDYYWPVVVAKFEEVLQQAKKRKEL